MESLGLRSPDGRPPEVLCLGAHCDDIEIGCGGTLLRILDEHPGASCRWVVFTGEGRRGEECRRSAEAFLARAGERRVEVMSFRDGFLPFQGAEVKERFEALKAGGRPSIIFTHHRADWHQDHRLISELTWNTFRDHLVLEYEVPKWDGDLGQPNVYVPLDADHCRRKVEHLMRCYPTQSGKDWYTEETFRALLRLRGVECRAAGGAAEAFHGRKLLLESFGAVR